MYTRSANVLQPDPSGTPASNEIKRLKKSAIEQTTKPIQERLVQILGDYCPIEIDEVFLQPISKTGRYAEIADHLRMNANSPMSAHLLMGTTQYRLSGGSQSAREDLSALMRRIATQMGYRGEHSVAFVMYWLRLWYCADLERVGGREFGAAFEIETEVGALQQHDVFLPIESFSKTLANFCDDLEEKSRQHDAPSTVAPETIVEFKEALTGGVESIPSQIRRQRARPHRPLRASKNPPGLKRKRIYKLLHKKKLLNGQTGLLITRGAGASVDDVYDRVFDEAIRNENIPATAHWEKAGVSLRTIGDAWDTKEGSIRRHMKVWITKLIADCAPHRAVILKKSEERSGKKRSVK